jgi:GntR family transcriptional regulator / MocR family aminotransferase
MTRRAPIFDLPITLARDAASVHDALYGALRDAMLSGRLGPGMRLPSTRDLAQQLQVARGTVVASYAQLASEGYLTGRTGSGTFVAAQLPDRWFAAPRADAKRPQQRRPITLSRWGRTLEDSPFAAAVGRSPRPFRPHIPAVDAFPVEIWARLLARRARRDDALFLTDGDVRGYRPLRDQLAEHLRVARGVICHAEQLVIVPSVQQVIDLVTRITLDPGDLVWMEDPGYVGARAVFAAAGVQIVPVPVDAHGIDVAAGIRLAPRARLAYVTPGHQAPLGVTQTIDRRLALLDWARGHGALILEDDYDSEYRYEGRPVPALQGLDRAGLVVHTGTFSKTLLPSFRLAYAVLPESLLERFLTAKSIVDRFTPALAQAVLADFIEGGHFGRHLRRMREIYAERRAALLSALASELGGAVQVLGASAGLDVTVLLPARSNERAVCRALAQASLEFMPLAPHAISARTGPGLVLGFAAFSPARLRRSVGLLARALT